MQHNGKQIKHEGLEQLGYSLHANCVDSFGHKWKYRTFPMGSGPINQFNSRADVDKYCAQVEQVRSWQR